MGRLHEAVELRSYQRSLVEYISNTLHTHTAVAIEAPTGSGKTLIGLVSAIEFAKKNGKKIVYLTRTNSQQEQVLKELRKLSVQMGLKAVAIQGRHNLCPLYREFEDEGEFSAESLSRFCNIRKRKVHEGHQEACRFYNGKVTSNEILDKLFREIPDADAFMDYGIIHTVCPYESLKNAASRAEIVVAPYAYFLNQPIAERFLSRWGVGREDLVIIMDEAHNIPDLARELASFAITMKNIDLAEKEAHEFGDAELAEKFRTTDFCEMLRNSLLDLTREFLKEREEARIQFRDLVEYAAIGTKISLDDFWSLTSIFSLFGEQILQKKEDMGRIPRSHVAALAGRLMSWRISEDDGFVAVLSGDDSGKVEAFCMEPLSILEPLKRSRSIHMSGTLEPIQIYRNITGFTDMPSRKVENIFPAENRQVIYYDDISTKYDEFDHDQAIRLRDLIQSIVTTIKRKTLIFFTSYNVMERLISIGFSFDFLAESRRMSQQDLMALLQAFRKGSDPLFGVMGGRISEGMNFPGEQLELVIIVGVPYPKPDAKNKALYAYYESVYGNGWEYAMTFPVLIKLRQAMGRLIRDSTDIGSAIILDRRAAYFRSYLPEMKLSRDPAHDAELFFSGRENVRTLK